MKKLIKKFQAGIFSIIFFFFFAACGQQNQPAIETRPLVTPTATTLPSPTSTITAKPTILPTATPVVLKNGTLRQVFPDLDNLSAIESFYLADDWDGDIGYRPLIAHYSFTRRGNLFEVATDFSSGTGQGHVQTTYNFTIQASIVDNFLTNLENIPVNEGKYEPVIHGAGSYDLIKFEAIIGDEKLSIFTESTTYDLAPWGLGYAGREFVVSSDLPTKAVKELRPFLHRDILAKLVGILPGWCGPGFPCP